MPIFQSVGASSARGGIHPLTFISGGLDSSMRTRDASARSTPEHLLHRQAKSDSPASQVRPTLLNRWSMGTCPVTTVAPLGPLCLMNSPQVRGVGDEARRIDPDPVESWPIRPEPRLNPGAKRPVRTARYPTRWYSTNATCWLTSTRRFPAATSCAGSWAWRDSSRNVFLPKHIRTRYSRVRLRTGPVPLRHLALHEWGAKPGGYLGLQARLIRNDGKELGLWTRRPGSSRTPVGLLMKSPFSLGAVRGKRHLGQRPVSSSFPASWTRWRSCTPVTPSPTITVLRFS